MAKTQGNKEVTERYAKALFASASAQGVLPVVEKDVSLVQEIFNQSADVRRLAESPLVSRKQQAAGIKAVLEKAGVSVLLQKFGQVLAENRRLMLLPAVLEAFLVLLSEERGEVTVELISATALEATSLAAISSQIETSLGKKLRLKARVDPRILGGLVIKIGSTMIDDSIRSKLERLQSASKNAVAAL